MRSKLITFLPVLIVLTFIGLALTGCDVGSTKPSANDQRKNAIETRTEVFARAESVSPAVKPVNFPLRKALNKYTARQDLLDHPWYIYVEHTCYTCAGGVSYTYFVGQTYPISTCDFLSSTSIVTDGGDAKDSGRGNVVIPAPSLDGIYYGGSGASGGCDYFFFDAETDAMQVISSTNQWFVSDSLVAIDATPIKVRNK